MVVNIPVRAGSSSYSVQIGSGNLYHYDFSAFGKNRAAILADSAMATHLVPQALAHYLGSQGIEAVVLNPVASGEQSKTFAAVESAGIEFAANGFGRNSLLFAVGGGVVGDLAGFLASIYMRGIGLVHVTTTLLAMVDSSIGGKTAIDVSKVLNGKNLFGTFYQPLAVIDDVKFLKTLPEMEIGNGLAEAVKTALIADSGFFGYLELNHSRRNEEFYQLLVERCVRIKASIVGQDERDTSLRRVLNYGHTLGHALEAETGYGIVKHGAAVAVGMVFAGELAVRLGLLDRQAKERQDSLIQAVGLPASYSGKVSIDSLVERMKGDKKSAGRQLSFVLLESIGKATDGLVTVDEKLVREILPAVLS